MKKNEIIKTNKKIYTNVPKKKSLNLYKFKITLLLFHFFFGGVQLIRNYWFSYLLPEDAGRGLQD